MHFLDRSFFVVRLITNKVPADANFSFCLVVWFGAGKVSNGEAQQRHPQRPLQEGLAELCQDLVQPAGPQAEAPHR
jgi:hypothetical protein